MRPSHNICLISNVSRQFKNTRKFQVCRFLLCTYNCFYLYEQIHYFSTKTWIYESRIPQVSVVEKKLPSAEFFVILNNDLLTISQNLFSPSQSNEFISTFFVTASFSWKKILQRRSYASFREKILTDPFYFLINFVAFDPPLKSCLKMSLFYIIALLYEY